MNRHQRRESIKITLREILWDEIPHFQHKQPKNCAEAGIIRAQYTSERMDEITEKMLNMIGWALYCIEIAPPISIEDLGLELTFPSEGPQKADADDIPF